MEQAHWDAGKDDVDYTNDTVDKMCVGIDTVNGASPIDRCPVENADRHRHLSPQVKENPLNFVVPARRIVLSTAATDRLVNVNVRLGFIQEGTSAGLAGLAPAAIDLDHFEGGCEGGHDEVRIPHEVAPVSEKDEVLGSTILIDEARGNQPSKEVGEHCPAEDQIDPLPFDCLGEPLRNMNYHKERVSCNHQPNEIDCAIAISQQNSKTT